jgi:site-specific DNA-methyltransferase (cytosine-N4-specific)
MPKAGLDAASKPTQKDPSATELLGAKAPYYTTKHGAAFLGDASELLKHVPDKSANLVFTSPPFALLRKKDYGNVAEREYIEWFKPFAAEIQRILKDDGSFVIDIGGTWNKGTPTRSLYHFKLLISLCEDLHYHLAQDFYWYNPARLPTPAEWVTVRRCRVTDAVDPIWWLSKTPNPKANNRNVLVPYTESMRQLLAKGYKARVRPSGHDISDKFRKDNGGAIARSMLIIEAERDPRRIRNVLSIANTDSNGLYLQECRKARIKPHSARFPRALPEFFVKLLTDRGDLVIDPFAGSNTTGAVCEALQRRWIAFELGETHLQGSAFRFNGCIRSFRTKP